jgi:hypothetical protein
MTTTALEDTIDRAQQRLNEALVDGDAATLTELVSPDCRIIGPKGFIVAKDEWINVHASGVYTQVLLHTVESELLPHGDTVIRSDIQQSECLYQGEHITGLFRVLSVWVRTSGHWQLAATQYTALPTATG